MYILLIIALFLEFAGIFSRPRAISLYSTVIHSILSALGIHSAFDPEPLWEHEIGGPIRRIQEINWVEVQKEWVWDVIGAACIGVLIRASHHYRIDSFRQVAY